ncbi:TPA: hypothetical protein DEP21_01420 [Patescibacteria group bacterium]|nr:hypothetical protein [Candidatus Gracilibacteria bacterium]
MTWNKFTVPSGKSFAYYKVIRSQTKDNPLYPEDGYIRYDSNLDFTSYTDESPLQGKTYYRVCAILDGQKRYCSNVVKVTITETSSSSETEQEEEVVKQPRTTPTPIKATELSDSTKALLDNIATEFLAKVEAKFGSTSSSAKNGFLTSIIAQLDKLGKRSTKMKPLITYLNAKIEEQIDPLNEIQEILKVE